MKCLTSRVQVALSFPERIDVVRGLLTCLELHDKGTSHPPEGGHPKHGRMLQKGGDRGTVKSTSREDMMPARSGVV